MRIRNQTLLPLAWLSLTVLPASAFYNPSTGKWPNRDPIEEKGGLNHYAFVKNEPTARIDRLGLDYYIVQRLGVCGVRHRVLIGDDGLGDSYQIEFFPDLAPDASLIHPGRLCGKGVVEFTPRTGTAKSWAEAKENLSIEQYTPTSGLIDGLMAERAAKLDGKKIPYCIGVLDCRNINAICNSRTSNAYSEAISNVHRNLVAEVAVP
jgi:hypothetical protein